MSGADWQVIGDALEVSPRTARIHFAMAEAAFRELLSPERVPAAGEAGRLRGYMAREPLEVALDLDDWVLRHEDGDSDLGTTPVSGSLVRRGPRRRAWTHPGRARESVWRSTSTRGRSNPSSAGTQGLASLINS